jgi:phage tail sheath gpL-like
MATVAFNNIPGNILVPFFYAEINSGGSPFQGEARLLLIGQKLAAGSAPADVPVGPVGSETEAIALFGNGSMLVDMYRYARRNAPFQPIWVVPLADPAGAAAVGSVTFTAPGITGVGVLSVAGLRITFQVNAADTATVVATSARDAINAAGIPVSASNAAGVLTVTSRHVGLLGNGIELRVKTDEANVLTPVNAVVVAIGTGTAGTGTPTLTTALANLGDEEFDWIAAPYADTTSLNAIRDFLSDNGTGRWSPIKQLYGHYITAAYGNLSTLVTLGNGRNDRHVSIVGAQVSPDPVWRLAAAVGGQAASHLSDAPEVSRPLQTLELVGIQPPINRANWWSVSDRQALYVDGIGACRVDRDGIVRLDRIVTTEQTSAAGVPDATFRDIETLGQMMFVARYFRTGVANRHARQALADDNPGQVAEITTPREVKMTLVHLYRELVNLGVLEKADVFASFVVVERDLNDATRLNAFLPVDVVNQLRVFAANITTFLQYR